jgi:hypothetical protein
MTEDVTVAEPETTENTQDQAVETVDVADTPDDTVDSQNDAQSEDEGNQEPEMTTEEKLEKLQRETKGQQKAIDRKTAAYRDLQKAYERERQELEQLRQAQQQAQADVKPPSPDDFDTHEEYDKARLDYEVERRLAHKQDEFVKAQQMQQQQKLAQERTSLAMMHEKEYLSVNPNYESSKKEFSDYLAVANVPKDVEAAFVQQAYKGNTAQLIDYFGADNGARLDKLQEIAGMNPIDAAIEVYKIQQTLDAPKKKETKPAPKPIKTKGKGSPRRGIDPNGDVLKQLGLK